tara:strand:- start:426 stop:1049 length:624 start_codon:yes stop_codon:yes gene_type:complete
MLNLIKRDLLLSFYSSANFFFTMSFFILVLILLPFAFGTEIDQLNILFKGIVWIALSLSIILTVDRIFNADYEDGNLDIIMQKNKNIELLIIGKYVTHWIIYCFPLLAVLPILSFLFYLNYNETFQIFLNLLIGSFGMIFISTFVSALTLGARRTIFLKTIIMMPLLVPFIIFGSDTNSWSILLALSMLSFVLSIYVTSYALRLYGE